MSGTIRPKWDYTVLEIDVEVTHSGRSVAEVSTGDIISLVAAMTDTERTMFKAALGL